MKLNQKNKIGKSGLIIYVLILTLILSLIYQFKVVYADSFNTVSDEYSDTIYNVHGESFNVDGVKQSINQNSITTFGSALPIATINLDYSKINEEVGTFKLLTDKSNIAPGIGYDFLTENNGNTSKLVYYDPTIDTENLIQLYPNRDNVLSGDLFSFTYDDAAILSDGTRANLEIVFSNIHITIDQRYTGHNEGNDGAYNGKVTITQGYNAWYRGTDGTDLSQFNSTRITGSMANPITTYKSLQKRPMIGESMDVCIKIVDDDGNTLNGTFILGVYGINIDRSPITNQNMAKPLWYLEDIIQDYGAERETVEVKGGVASDNIYVRPNTIMRPDDSANSGYFYPDIIKANDSIKFIANSTDVQYNNTEYTIGKQGSNSEYSTGFITLADANGIKLTCYGHGGFIGDNTGMATTILQRAVIDHTITSSSGTGGTIKTTDEGNYNGDLSDGNILGSGTYGVANGKTVTYTIAPKDGYRLKNVIVDGNSLTLPLETDGTETIDIDEGITGTLKNKGNGIYTFEFPANNADHTIHVDWNADHYFIKNWLPEDLDSLTFIAKAYTFDGTNFVSAGIDDITFTVNKTDENVVEVKTTDGGKQWIIRKTDLLIEPEDSEHVGDHDNPYYWFISEVVPDNYTLKGYDNSSVSHTNYYEDADVNTAWQDAVRNKTDGAYAAIIREGAEITNIIYKKVTVKKHVTGNAADHEKEFTYRITIYNGDTPINENLSIEKNGNTFTIESGGVFTLKHEETAVIKNLPKGCKYIIEETDTDYIESFKIIKADNDEVLIDTTEGIVIPKQTLNEDQIVEFTNKKDEEQTKIDDQDEEDNKKEPEIEVNEEKKGIIPLTGSFINNSPYNMISIIGIIGVLGILFIKRKNSSKKFTGRRYK